MSLAAEASSDDVQPRILCVDDDVNLLEGMRRILSEEFDVLIAPSGQAALQFLEQTQVSVVVSDMRMPGMDGATLLAHVKAKQPDASRILLTGQADLRDAMRAVNDGQLFRFLLKPCPPGELGGTIHAAVEHNRLITAERQLLEQTVNGVIRLLVDVLALASPTGFRAAGMAKQIVQHLEKKLGRPASWEAEAAAMLSSVGCIALPPDLLDRVIRRAPVSDVERGMFNQHPEAGRKLLAAVPRLERVAVMIGAQNDRGGERPKDDVAVGAALVRVAVLAAELILEGNRPFEVPPLLRKKLHGYDINLAEHVGDVQMAEETGTAKNVTIDGLRVGMHLVDGVKSKSGTLLVPGGQELTAPLVERLRKCHAGVGVAEPIRVIVVAAK